MLECASDAGERALAMRNFYESLARWLYGLVALPMPLLSVLFLASWFDYAPSSSGADFLSMWFWAALAVVGLLLPSLRAWRRMWRGHGLLPAESLRAQPLAGALAVGAILLAIGIVVFIATAPRETFPTVLGVSALLAQLWKSVIALCAVALLLGEGAVAGRDS
jgi:hypothetical protein